MKYSASQINPLIKVLAIFPVTWTTFSISMYRDFISQMHLGGWEAETEKDCYLMLKELSSMGVLEIKWDSCGRPIKTIRKIGD